MGSVVELERALAAAGLSAPVRWEEVTSSTNATASAMAGEGAPEWTLAAAGHQTAGRGRRGRSWTDVPDSAILCSLVLRPPIDPDEAGILTLLAGAAWAESIGATTGRVVRCKWPNDLEIDDAKVGGILGESVVRDGRLDHVVIGSGVNLVPPDGLDRPTAGLGSNVDRSGLLGTFLVAFREGYRPTEAGWVRDVLDRWRAVASTIGRRVEAERGRDGPVRGTAIDVDERGGLVIECAEGSVTVSFGDVTHLA